MRTPISLLSSMFLIFSTPSTWSEEIRVLSANNFRPLISAISSPFEAETKNSLLTTYDSTGGVRRRIAAGEVFDIILVEDEALSALEQSGAVTPGSRRRIAKAVMVLMAKPDSKINSDSPAGFRRAIEGAKAVALPDPRGGGLSGPMLVRILKSAGFAELSPPKFIFAKNTADAVRMVESGEADIGASQLNEIRSSLLSFANIPAEFGSELYLSGGISSSLSKDQQKAAQSVLDYLSSSRAAKYIEGNRLRLPN